MKTQDLLKNATSGFLVFLIALPLCLGIAMASGFPPIAGVTTAVIGGILVSPLGSAPLSIKGPAAGLIVIALGAVQELGGGDPMLGYKRALAVGVAAAVLQILFSVLKAGRFASVMPPSVVHGMLAAIGVIIIAKQLPVMLGVLGAHGEPLEMLLEVPHYLSEANPAVAAVGAIGLVLLVALPLLPWPKLKKVPAPLVVLLLTVPLAAYFGFGSAHAYSLGGEQHQLGPELLVSLSGSLLDAVVFPDFSVLFTPTSLKYIVMFALVGTVEGLLSVIAVDGMDPEKKASDLNRDLMVTGIGNLACAMLGGLPMISEIVRSKANVDAGATGPSSNFFHGLFLLAFVALMPGLLQMIPLAALAAMLVVTGARLASPKEFVHAWKVGKDQFALFVVTFVVTLATDLLIGVAAGLLLKIALHAYRGRSLSNLFKTKADLEYKGETAEVHVHGPLVFTNFLSLGTLLQDALDHKVKSIRIDLSDATMIDHTAQERLEGMAEEWPSTSLELVGLDAMQGVSADSHAFRRAQR